LIAIVSIFLWEFRSEIPKVCKHLTKPKCEETKEEVKEIKVKEIKEKELRYQNTIHQDFKRAFININGIELRDARNYLDEKKKFKSGYSISKLKLFFKNYFLKRNDYMQGDYLLILGGYLILSKCGKEIIKEHNLSSFMNKTFNNFYSFYNSLIKRNKNYGLILHAMKYHPLEFVKILQTKRKFLSFFKSLKKIELYIKKFFLTSIKNKSDENSKNVFDFFFKHAIMHNCRISKNQIIFETILSIFSEGWKKPLFSGFIIESDIKTLTPFESMCISESISNGVNVRLRFGYGNIVQEVLSKNGFSILQRNIFKRDLVQVSNPISTYPLKKK
jgi:hypothetical protein